jgi:cyclophilin family peptidyl-prolyl cis-trans isomerase
MRANWLVALVAAGMVMAGGPAVWGEGGAEGAEEQGKVENVEETTVKPEENGSMSSDVVVMTTSKGVIKIRLDAAKAPLTVQNFLKYVDEGHYDGTIFHRVINGFMIQGGGFDQHLRQKPTHAPIKNEAMNGLKNRRGTIAMARTMVVDSATSQFFINVVDNGFLDFRAPTAQGFGYCVFGEVIEGMEVVDAIKVVPTGNAAGMGDVPKEPVVIVSVRRAEAAE